MPSHHPAKINAHAKNKNIPCWLKLQFFKLKFTLYIGRYKQTEQQKKSQYMKNVNIIDWQSSGKCGFWIHIFYS